MNTYPTFTYSRASIVQQNSNVLSSKKFCGVAIQLPIFPRTGTTPTQRKEKKSSTPVCHFPNRFYDLYNQLADTGAFNVNSQTGLRSSALQLD